MTLSAPEIAKKWARNAAGATQSMREGVANVTVNPMEKAAAAQDRYLAGVQSAVQSGKYRDGLLSVSLTDWKTAMLDKGIPRVAAGVAAAEPKFQKFLNSFLPFVETVQRELDSMPRGDLQQNLARMMHNATRLSEFKFMK